MNQVVEARVYHGKSPNEIANEITAWISRATTREIPMHAMSVSVVDVHQACAHEDTMVQVYVLFRVGDP
jgi:hypothetical protein